ncbi:hypothetical protein [Actinoplanes sp. NPDC026619]|uniref:hypothetical protein n=1 Tax=Actinoplanes sp. NPDC026619 TaxID=3155798 RepID=UPI0034059A5B
MTGSVQLKQVGFYKSAEDLLAVVGSAQYPWEPMAVRYLEQGMTVLVSPGWVDDLLDPQAKMICQYSTLTDGKWVWSSDLSYYLRAYHVALPDEFVAHMASRDWVVPELGEAELDAICEHLEKQHGLS